jgi:hypothetical protein
VIQEPLRRETQKNGETCVYFCARFDELVNSHKKNGWIQKYDLMLINQGALGKSVCSCSSLCSHVFRDKRCFPGHREDAMVCI